MKIAHVLFACSLIALAGCSTATPPAKASAAATSKARAKDRSETVLVTYHVKPGMEIVFEHMIDQAWQTYRREHLVLAEPHVVVREAEENNTTGYIEIFTWVSHAAPEHVSEAVKQIWAQEVSLCQTRNGKPGLGGGEVEPIVPPRK